MPADISGLRSTRPPPTAIPAPRPRLGSRVVLPAGVLVAFGGVLAFAARDALLPATPVRVVPVVAKALTGAEISAGTVTAQAAGWVEPDPFPTFVSALTDGIVAEVLVLEGQAVEANQVVARLVPDDARLALARAEADLRDAVAVREAAAEELETLVERRRAADVAAARVEESAAMVAMNLETVAAQRARVRELEEQVRRDEPLVAAEVVDELTLVRTRLQLDARRAELHALEANATVLEAQAKRAAAERHAADEALRLLIPERRALEQAKAAADEAKAACDEAALRVERLEIRAPMAGIVAQRHAAPGSKVIFAMDSAKSATVMHMYDPEHLQVRVDVPLADAARVGVGHAARIVVEVLPDRVFQGEVSRIVHEADLQKNTLQVKVRILDPTPELKPEMLARAQFLAPAPTGGAEGSTDSARAERLLVPERLLRRDGGDRASVLVVEGGVAVQRAIRTGSVKENGWVDAVEGIVAGDRLIDVLPDGDAAIEPGARVRVTGESTPEGGRP